MSIAGRPNVGKSTLVNRLVGRKVSITSRRPQTTRHRILGIRTDDNAQMILVDTPGLHDGEGRMINRVINRTARNSLAGVDVLVLMINASGWKAEDEIPLKAISDHPGPKILVINKIDRLKDKSRLLPLIEESRQRFDFDEIVPLSALTGDNVEHFYRVLLGYLPTGPQCFPEGEFTDRNNRFVVAELVREQLFRQLGEELPYVTAVQLDRFEEEDRIIRVHANIWVERSSHKAIVIGRGGERLKSIGSNARRAIEDYTEKKVFLELWVKVRDGWRDDGAALAGLGYSEE